MTEQRGARRRNVAKLLARLNPKSMPLQASGGGGMAVPVETPIDIAAALGAAAWGERAGAKRLAVLVLCMRWWPGVIEGPGQVVGYREEVRVVERRRVAGKRAAAEVLPPPVVRGRDGRRLSKEEISKLPPPIPRKVEVLKDPKLDDEGRPVWEKHRSSYIERVPIVAPAETPAFREVASLLSTSIERSILRDQYRAQRRISDDLWAWVTKGPRSSVVAHGPLHGAPLADDLAARVLADQFLGAWARLVIHEYRHPHHCQTCTPWGRAGEVPKFEGEGAAAKLEWVTCPICLGAGTLAWGSKRRAQALSIGEHPFRNYLKPHHDGALALLRELEWRGARLMLRRLGVSDER